jgi:hypothetical protein
MMSGTAEKITGSTQKLKRRVKSHVVINADYSGITLNKYLFDFK